ncbi:hypothetical protein [Chitinophaga sp.]|uniref:hypothetical protein n=1 Tax=Chitinophaga sp. TaxID=1869181 RepID=UPI002F9472F3
MMRIAIVVACAAILGAACHPAPANDDTGLPGIDTVVASRLQPPPDTVAPALLKDKPLEEAIAIAGPSDEATEFYMSDSLSEFRIGLFNFFKRKDYLRQRIQIKEVTWYNGEKNITVWYREEDFSWRFITMSVWDKDANF